MTPLICAVKSCERQAHARGLCGKHYQRWRVHGDPEWIAPRYASMEVRFWARVEKTPTCWNWTAAKTTDGYGSLWNRESRRAVYTHRYSYELNVGPIPDGLTIDHLCRNRACCNPDHLEPVTSAENTRRALPDVTECVNGHSYITGDHVYVRPDGRGRQCRTCSIEKRRALRAAS